jgi:putative DNA primase/helicase
LPPVDPFPLELLPDALRPWVTDAAMRMQIPPDYIAIGIMVAAGAVIGRQVAIQPKRHDDWSVVPNLWGHVIGRPGLLKTPALQEALIPVQILEAAARAEHDREHRVWKARVEIEGEAKKLRGQKIREQLKAHRNPDNLAREIADDQSEIPEPVRRRFITNDATVEKLGELLRDNPNGIIVFRDELMGWLKSLEQETRGADLAFYLEA